MGVQAIHRVQAMVLRFGDLQGNLLRYVALAAEGASQPDQLDALQKATGWLPSEAAALMAGPFNGWVPTATLLGALDDAFALMGTLGASPPLMDRIAALGAATAAADWDAFEGTAADVLAKAVGRYGAGWDAVWGALSGILAVRERDALLALVLAQLNGQHKGIVAARNVYEFLLTDVEMGPATQISPILEALNAAQLYLQRCRLRLEPGVTDLSHIQDA